MSPMDVLYALLLSSVGLAGTINAQVCPPPPSEPNTVLSDADILKEEFEDGSDAHFVCEVGYEYAGGSRTVTCRAGSWGPLRMKCERKDCGSPGEVENGMFDLEGTEFGDKAVAKCNNGYVLVGRGERTCLVEGWSGRVPVCEVVHCNTPPEVANALPLSPNKEVYDYRDVVVYRCKNDYTLNGSSSISCSEDGTFKPAPPKCIKVVCEAPNVPNANWDGGARPPYGYKSFVTYKCITGFTMKGTSSVTCDINSKWTPALPTCVRVPPPTTKADTTTTTTPPPPTPEKTTESDGVPVTPKPTDPPHNGGIGVGVGIGIGLVVAIIVGGLAYYCIKKKSRAKRSYPTDGPL